LLSAKLDSELCGFDAIGDAIGGLCRIIDHVEFPPSGERHPPRVTAEGAEPLIAVI